MKVNVQALRWSDEALGTINFPKQKLCLSSGFGSGLTTAPGEGGPLVWAISDRGPNLKVKEARKTYGWNPSGKHDLGKGAKLMPRPDIGPAIALLKVTDTAVELKQTIRLKDGNGRAISGLPIPESGHAECEPVFDLDGRAIEPDPDGMDTEGLAMLPDGSFWAGEEYGPSLVKIGSQGEILLRIVPEGTELPGASFPVRASIPAIAARRHLNRGFEAVTATPSGDRLYLAFQSPLAHPAKREHKHARHVRLWQLDAQGDAAAQFVYRLDDPESFLRDQQKGPIDRSDIKVCELVAIGEHVLLVLERGSETTKIYRVALDPGRALGAEHWQIDHRPTVEQMSCEGGELPELDKQLLFSSDDWPQVGADIEGMAMLDARTLLIVSDNDFGCEGKQTGFYRLSFDEELASGRTG